MYCGIDFGTSNSTIGVAVNGTPGLVALERAKTILPSAIFFTEDDEDDEIYIGRAAIDEYVSGMPGRFMRSIKSALGTGLIEETTRIGKRNVSLRDVIAYFLRHAKERAEAHLGAELTHVVQGRPVRFTIHGEAADRKAQDQLETILREIGFQEIQFLYEPVAAARCIDGIGSERKTVFIADIGGGTSDFTVIRFDQATGQNGQVLANHGIRLGGTDFDYALNFKHIQPLFGRGMVLDETGLTAPSSIYRSLSFWPEINTAYNKRTFDQVRWMTKQAPDAVETARLTKLVEGRLGHKVALDAERAKIDLSDRERTEIDFAYLEAGLRPELLRAHLQDAIAEDLLKLSRAVTDTLRDAGIGAEEVDLILMTGGSTGMPSVEAAIRSCMPGAETLDGDRLAAVGHGLTVEAQAVFD